MDKDNNTSTTSHRGITGSAILLALVVTAGVGYWVFFRQPDEITKDSASVNLELADPLAADLHQELPAIIDPSERIPAIDGQAAISRAGQLANNEIEEIEEIEKAPVEADKIITTSIGTLAPVSNTDDSFVAQGSQHNEVGPGRVSSASNVRGIITGAGLEGSIEDTMKVSPTAQTGPSQLAWVIALAMAFLGAAGLARLHRRSRSSGRC